MSGSGQAEIASLTGDRLDVVLRGAGQVRVHAVQTLAATVSGAGSVEYLGSPTVTQSVTGAGTVRRPDGPA